MADDRETKRAIPVAKSWGVCETIRTLTPEEAKALRPWTPERIGKLRARVQERGALYDARGLNPLAVEAILDEVAESLWEFQAVVANARDGVK